MSAYVPDRRGNTRGNSPYSSRDNRVFKTTALHQCTEAATNHSGGNSTNPGNRGNCRSNYQGRNFFKNLNNALKGFGDTTEEPELHHSRFRVDGVKLVADNITFRVFYAHLPKVAEDGLPKLRQLLKKRRGNNKLTCSQMTDVVVVKTTRLRHALPNSPEVRDPPRVYLFRKVRLGVRFTQGKAAQALGHLFF